MSKHVTYRGSNIDMDSIRRENEEVPAIGNMKVNARGDQLASGGVVTKTADQIARENHRVQTAILHTGLKGPIPAGLPTELSTTKAPVKPTTKKAASKEVEMPSGDIVVEDDNDIA